MSRPDGNWLRNLQAWEVRAIVTWFFYRMKPEDRAQLMRDLPSVYNAVCGWDVVKVVHAEDSDA